MAALLVLRMLGGYARLMLALRRASPCDDPRLIELLDRTGLRAVETSIVTGPALVGIWRPQLLVPPGLIDRLTTDELRFVVLHEVAHARRLDVLVGAAVAVITALHWFNPLAWFAAARFRAERELACDQWVLARTRPEERAVYGRTILRLLDLFPPPPRDGQVVGVAGALSSGRTTMRRRIAAIATCASSMKPRRQPLGPLVLLVVAVATLTGPARSKSAPAPPASAPAPATTQNTVTRAYDVRDLLIEVPDVGDALDERGWPLATTRPTTSSAAARDALLAELIAEITSTIEPSSWRANTGTLGSIREEQGQLIVTQSPANHEKVLRKIQQLRAPRALHVTVEARFLSGRDVTKALGDGFAKHTNLYHRFLDRDDVQELLRVVQSEVDASTVTAPRLTLFKAARIRAAQP